MNAIEYETATAARSSRRKRRRLRIRMIGAASIAGSFLLVACGSGGVGGGNTTGAGGAPTATGPISTNSQTSTSDSSSTSHSNELACLMISEGGLGEPSGFNKQAWTALQNVHASTGIQIKYLAQSGSVDYPTIGAQFVQEGCNIIVGQGFDTAETIQKLAPANPKIQFVVTDTVLTKPEPNAVSLHYEIDQASFLAGYAAAGMSKSKIVGVVGNVAIPPVELYMNGWVAGIEYYDKVNHAAVKAIGWNPKTKAGSFVGNFTDTSKAKLLAQSEIQQGADIILPLIDGTEPASLAAGGPGKGYYQVHGDTDGCVTNQSYCKIYLTSILKNITTSLTDALGKIIAGKLKSGTYEGTLANKGVGLAPFHDAASAVPASLKSQLTKLEAKVAAGKVSTKPSA